MSRSDSVPLAVIGAGAAGLLAAIAAGEHGVPALVLEKNAKPGIKILMSGGGRCNVTNTGDLHQLVRSFPQGGRFLYSALAAFGPADIVALLDAAGVPTRVEDRGRVFPVSGKAADVVAALVQKAVAAGAVLRTGQGVADLQRSAGGCFTLCLARGASLTARRVIVTTGGMSYPTAGTTGDGYAWAARLGHTVTPPAPGLVALETVETWPAAVKGVALRGIEVRVTAQGRVQAREVGDALFTHFGLSGPAVLAVSRAAVRAAQPGAGPVHLGLSLEPGTTAAQWEERLQAALADGPRRQLKRVVSQWWPAALGPVLLPGAGIPPESAAGSLTRVQRQAVAALLHEITLTLRRPRPLAEAMVTAGGVELAEIDPRTMHSRLVPGLYFAGEILDVDGITGGYNLQAAYATGWLAGRSAAQSLTGKGS